MLNLKKQYELALQRSGFICDQHQLKAVDALDQLSHTVCQLKSIRKPVFAALTRILLSGKNCGPVKGCYLWGGVGRGKTWLMDLFFNSLPIEDKQRWHFHEFMQYIHRQLGCLEKQREPLTAFAIQIATKHRIICLDEFFVDDITDAMLLHGLLRALMEQGIVLVVTSNVAPDELYKNGLQRERFVPAIDLLKQYTDVIKLDGQADYRWAAHERSYRSYYLESEISQAALLDQVCGLRRVSDTQCQNSAVILNNRQIPVIYKGDNCICFAFDDICGTGRATGDYLTLAANYKVVVICEIPVLSSENDDMAKRFAHLVDALYDHKTILVLRASVPMEHLYQGMQHQFMFSRTLSRLVEMGGRDYHGNL